MRRMTIAIAALTVIVGLGSTIPTAAASETPTAGSLHKPWIQWAFGSSGAPLLDQDFCGEMVNGVFFMTVAGGQPTSVSRTVNCEVPDGVPILATPGGVIAWAPTDGKTDNQLQRSIFNQLGPLKQDSVHVRLDGTEIPHGRLVSPDPYTIALEPGNLIQTIDPGVTGDSTRVADAFYFKVIDPLDPGDHVIITRDSYDYRSTGGEVVTYRTKFLVHVS